MSKKAPLSPAHPRRYDERDQEAVSQVLRKGHLSVVFGRQTVMFESELAKLAGRKAGVAVNSGTTALELALHCLDIGFGDEVIVPAYTFAGIALSVMRTLAVVRFCDIDAETWNLSPAAVLAQAGPRTRAVIVPHMFGNPVDIPALRAVLPPSILVVEDCAQAAGGSFDGRPIGSFGDIACFSFNEIKNMTTGEGGMIVTDDVALAERARLLRLHATTRGLVQDLGGKFTMTEMEAALGRSQLARLGAMNANRIALANRLREAMAALPGLTPQRVPAGGEHVYSRFVFAIDEDVAKVSRDALQAGLRQRQIQVDPVYGVPIYRHKLFEDLAAGTPGPGLARSYHAANREAIERAAYGAVRLEATEAFCARQLGFVLYDDTTQDEIEALISGLREILTH